ncbi:hypothetical protein [Ureibacillus chungkukjangi]|uniref:Uncharacterized protein n=1 Tax=Ureibacillus chungkukjangi TaxID=1202712 RepID=A0A318TUA8_9BACL|nr:hypothetical protein [Ureibacillus chungkukjangi]MCM3388323.1 hypothetical protein [Ureibacillus chungkukjangi]PYF08382.1 hypothetical protein BJ095_102148 [Ureibacillus chungkukjangi]
MTKNAKLLYCLLGSFVLAMLNSTLLGSALVGVFNGGGALEEFIVLVADILSFVGYILLIIFSLMLIYYNTKSKFRG